METTFGHFVPRVEIRHLTEPYGETDNNVPTSLVNGTRVEEKEEDMDEAASNRLPLSLMKQLVELYEIGLLSVCRSQFILKRTYLLIPNFGQLMQL